MPPTSDDPPFTSLHGQPLTGKEPPFISDHLTFTAKVQCVECGWTWEGWADDVDMATHVHTTETSHAE